MISKVFSAAVIGLEAYRVHVEVHFARGKSRFYMVGLPDKACSESKERVMAVIRNFLGRRVPAGIFTVNLAPADILKSGPVYDLPIAAAILNSLGEIKFESKNKLVIGELGLDGKTRHTKAILPIMDLAQENGLKEIYLPEANAAEAEVIPGVKIIPVRDLNQFVRHIKGKKIIQDFSPKSSQTKTVNPAKKSLDFSIIKGQDFAKRALEIAAAGSHNILMIGPPGSGKTMLAHALLSILPEMTFEESLEITKIYSVAGMLSKNSGLIRERAFRGPHHTISHVAMVGGGTIPRPGEISLAHRGVLFLDEFSEFSNRTLEALRQPLEDGVIMISRAKGSLTFPARVMFVAAMNPCKCGWLGDEKHDCMCSPADISKYKKKISGPVLDRIDMQINVARVEYDKLDTGIKSEASEVIAGRVQDARCIQLERFKRSAIITNSEMGQEDIQKYIVLDEKCRNLLRQAMETLHFSARSYFRILKIARTIADLEGEADVAVHHAAEALSFRIGDSG